MIRKLLLVFAGLVLTGCAFESTGPQPGLEGLPAGLAVEFTVEPGEVAQHAPFSVHLSVTNTTSDPIQVVTAHGCLAIPDVLRDGVRVPFRGSWWGCRAAITTHTFAPGETKSRTWEMRAELYAEHPGDVDGVPAPKTRPSSTPTPSAGPAGSRSSSGRSGSGNAARRTGAGSRPTAF